MVWWFFQKKRGIAQLKDEVNDSLNVIKEDLKKAADWIKHLHSRGEDHDFSLDNIDERMSSLENEMLEVKAFISFFGSRIPKQLSKQPQTALTKQTAVEGVQIPVQTAVQTSFLGNLTYSERMIVWALMNTEMKLSCEDIAVLLNKEKSTVRGQINNIKQKSSELIQEVLERSGKKRFFIPPEVKDMLLKKIKATRRTKKRKKRLKRS
ncbi:unnamed protein product [marine sediment metagenome]|uniref:Uncharacterized protein n=1 Tax=marine sediment metagenome TaxID=412755 RepID=X1LCD2_9ZZZZ